MKRVTFLFLTLCCLVACKPKSTKVPFTKIIFHTSACFGWCPVYHLQVDSDKTLKLYSEMVHRSAIDNVGDSTKMGYFTGKVADSTFNKLQNAINIIGIDTLRFKDITCCDAPVRTIIVYYNGKRRFLRSMFPPVSSRNLINLLQQICEQGNLQRATSKFDIEKSDTLKVSDVRFPQSKNQNTNPQNSKPVGASRGNCMS